MVVLICTPGLDLEVNLSVPAPGGEKTQKHTENENVSVLCGPQRGAVYVSIWWYIPTVSSNEYFYSEGENKMNVIF